VTPEGWVKQDIKKVLARYTPLWYFMPTAGAHGKAGIPDFIICANGKMLTIEAKAEGNKPTQLKCRSSLYRTTFADAGMQP
jgi:hypothetical protein